MSPRLTNILNKFAEARSVYISHSRPESFTTPEWTAFFEKLLENNIDPYEYLHYIVNYMQGRQQVHLVGYSNLIRSDKTIQRFLDAKPELRKTITLNIQAKIDKFRRKLECFSDLRADPITAIDKDKDLPSPLKIELIMQFAERPLAPEVEALLIKYAGEAMHVIRGMPVYLEICSGLTEFLHMVV